MEITDMKCCVPAISAKDFFNENTLLYRLTNCVLMCVGLEYTNEVYFGKMKQAGSRAVWVLEEFSFRKECSSRLLNNTNVCFISNLGLFRTCEAVGTALLF